MLRIADYALREAVDAARAKPSGRQQLTGDSSDAAVPVYVRRSHSTAAAVAAAVAAGLEGPLRPLVNLRILSLAFADLGWGPNEARDRLKALTFEAKLLLVAMVLGVVGYAVLQVLRRRAGGDASHGMLLGSGLPLLLLALHSFVDYPLRTAAVAALAAVLAGILLAPQNRRR